MANGFKTGGRTKGTPNKATAEIKDIAAKYAPAAMEKLAVLAGLKGKRKGATDQAMAAACKEIIDRHAGKTSQTVNYRHIGKIEDLTDVELENLARGEPPITTKGKAVVKGTKTVN